ncbi:MAG: histidine phosphatase family protein [Planctomycetes bacterium]|jgi:broad specificity phosphatase PhoE|nr:histidine phosphatase family protein [Planctomycetota bacterium]
MDRPSLLVIVRHAESERNVAKKGNLYFADEEARQIIKGIPDYKISLTPAGIIQARLTGPQIRKKFGIFDYIYHSGYNRTIQTMEEILQAYTEEEIAKMKIRMNPFIYERHSGYTYDMTTEEVNRYFPWLDDYWNTFGGFFSQPPGGESLAQVVERVYIFTNMLFRDRCGQKVLVITHGGTLRCIRFILERWDFDRVKSWPAGQSPRNSSVTTYEYDQATQRLELAEYNSVFY